MALIVIENLAKKTIQVDDFSKTILRHLQDCRIDWMHTCGGKGRCTTCAIQILAGSENIQPKTGAELKFESMGALRKNERLSCQSKIMGDIVIRVPDENKLPHLTYSD